jgi:hypothetical protein
MFKSFRESPRWQRTKQDTKGFDQWWRNAWVSIIPALSIGAWRFWRGEATDVTLLDFGVAVATFVIAFCLLPIIELSVNYLRAPRRIAEDQVVHLTGVLASFQDKQQIGGILNSHYRIGLDLKRFIFESDDAVHIDECQKRYREWREGYFNYIRDRISLGKAQYVDSVPSVSAASILGMKAGQYCDAKETLILHIEARMKRLADLMRDY